MFGNQTCLIIKHVWQLNTFGIYVDVQTFLISCSRK